MTHNKILSPCPVCGKPPEERPLTSEEFVDSHLIDGCLIECKGHLSSGYAANRALARDYWRCVVTAYKPTEKAKALSVKIVKGAKDYGNGVIIPHDEGTARLCAEIKDRAEAHADTQCCDGMPRLFASWGFDNTKQRKCLHSLPLTVETKAGSVSFIPCNPVVGACCACLCGEIEVP